MPWTHRYHGADTRRSMLKCRRCTVDAEITRSLLSSAAAVQRSIARTSACCRVWFTSPGSPRVALMAPIYSLVTRKQSPFRTTIPMSAGGFAGTNRTETETGSTIRTACAGYELSGSSSQPCNTLRVAASAAVSLTEFLKDEPFWLIRVRNLDLSIQSTNVYLWKSTSTSMGNDRNER